MPRPAADGAARHRMSAGRLGGRRATALLPGEGRGLGSRGGCILALCTSRGPGTLYEGHSQLQGWDGPWIWVQLVTFLGCSCFFPARSAKRSRKWQLHGSAVLVPLAAVGDNREDARGRREGGFSWCVVAAPPGPVLRSGAGGCSPALNPPSALAWFVFAACHPSRCLLHTALTNPQHHTGEKS